jgi:hypothetical protein
LKPNLADSRKVKPEKIWKLSDGIAGTAGAAWVHEEVEDYRASAISR